MDIVKITTHVQKYIEDCLEKGMTVSEITTSFRGSLPTALLADGFDDPDIEYQLRRIGQMLLAKLWIERNERLQSAVSTDDILYMSE